MSFKLRIKNQNIENSLYLIAFFDLISLNSSDSNFILFYNLLLDDAKHNRNELHMFMVDFEKPYGSMKWGEL